MQLGRAAAAQARGVASLARAWPPAHLQVAGGGGLSAARPAASRALASNSLPLIFRQQHSLLRAAAQAGVVAEPLPAAVAAAQQQQPAEGERPQAPSPYAVVNFYHLVDIKWPHEVIAQHKAFMEGRDIRGRIYISEQGINAQYGGRYEDAVAYAEWLAETQPLFKGLHYTIFPVPEYMHPKLRLKYRPNLISLAGGMLGLPMTDPAARATPVPPVEWRRMLAEARTAAVKPIVLDVRNDYEWDAGHFEGAERPVEDEFNQTPTEVLPTTIPPYLEAADPATPVMMYCTGGIRCDVYSTYLRRKGFSQLYTLEGGIQNYLRSEGLDFWNGSLFVFDGRMAVRPNKDKEEELKAAAPCQVCGAEAVLPHMNCANIDCNKLFIACEACRTHYNGCCCSECLEAPRLLRPAKTAGQYGTWRECGGNEEDIAAGRGPGRLSRRRKRLAALKVRELSKRQHKVERRHRGKEAMAERQAQQEQGEEEQQQQQELLAADAERAARLARLRELRERLISGSA